MATSPTQIRFTLRQLQYFAAVARTGQISLAAAESHVTQSTMTAAIAELERVLGHAAVRTRPQRRHADARRAPVPAAREQPCSRRLPRQHAIRSASAATCPGRWSWRPATPCWATSCCRSSPSSRSSTRAHAIVPVEADRAHIEASVASGEIELAVALTSNMLEPKRFQRVVLARSRRQLWVAAGHPLADLGAGVARGRRALPVRPADGRRRRCRGDALLERGWPAARIVHPHLVDGSGARDGRAGPGRHDPVGHGVPALVARRPAHPHGAAEEPDPADGSGLIWAQGTSA